MEVYTVEFYKFWDKEEDGELDSLFLSGEDAEEVIVKAKRIAFEKATWTEEPDEFNNFENPLIHKLSSIEIWQVIHKESLDG